VLALSANISEACGGSLQSSGLVGRSVDWLVVWALAWGYSKNIHFCNISGTIGMLLIAPFFESVGMIYFIIFLSGFILFAHRDVYKTALRN
jgi:uncharacterized membrane protein